MMHGNSALKELEENIDRLEEGSSKRFRIFQKALSQKFNQLQTTASQKFSFVQEEAARKFEALQTELALQRESIKVVRKEIETKLILGARVERLQRVAESIVNDLTSQEGSPLPTAPVSLNSDPHHPIEGGSPIIAAVRPVFRGPDGDQPDAVASSTDTDDSTSHDSSRTSSTDEFLVATRKRAAQNKSPTTFPKRKKITGRVLPKPNSGGFSDVYSRLTETVKIKLLYAYDIAGFCNEPRPSSKVTPLHEMR